MDTLEAIHGRRSAKRFVERRLRREEIEALLDAAIRAPNHRMTEPWGFVVLGPEAHRGYAELRAKLKSRRVEDAEAAAQVRDKVLADTLAIPQVIAVTCRQDEDPQTREEDYAATWMGIQNLLLAAHARGLGGYIHTGRIMELEELRSALGVADDERVVALLDLGEPAELPAARPRTPADEKTRWLP